MKKILSIFMLLVAFTTGAWAIDYNVTRYSQDYEDSGTFTIGWTLGPNVAAAQSSINGSKNLYLNVNSKNNVQRDNTLALSTICTYFSTAEEYQYSFEYGYSHGNGNAKDNSLILYAPENVVLFKITQPGNYCSGGVNTIYDKDNSPLATFTSEYNKGSKGVFLTFTVTGSKSANNVKLSVLNGSSTIVDNVTISSSFLTIDKLYLQMTGGASHYFFDNMLMKEYSNEDAVSAPIVKLTGVDGDNRKVSITSGTSSAGNEVTTYYTTNGEAPTSESNVYSSPITIESDCTVKAITISSSSASSDVTSLDVTTGEVILNTPTWAKSAYDSSTGISTITLASNQSNILLEPTATIYYTINGGAAKEYSSAIGVIDGQVLTYYAVAEGYTNSVQGSVTATAPCSYNTLWSETYNGIVAANSDLSLGSEVISTVNTTDYYNIYYNNGATLASEKLLANNVGSNYLMRANGLYNGGSWNLAIANLEVGDYVTFNGVYGNADFVVTGNSTDVIADDWNTSYGKKYCFVVKKEGTSRFTMNRYGYIQSITVQGNRVIGTLPESGIGTLASAYALDLSGVEAYVISNIDGSGRALCTRITEAPANTGIIIVGEKNAEYSIPVVASANAPASNLLEAAVEATPIDANAAYILQGGQFHLVNAESTVPAGKAYLPAANVNGAKTISLSFGEITGISEAEAAKATVAAEGKFIENGKLVIVKNGQKYNANGQLVK